MIAYCMIRQTTRTYLQDGGCSTRQWKHHFFHLDGHIVAGGERPVRCAAVENCPDSPARKGVYAPTCGPLFRKTGDLVSASSGQIRRPELIHYAIGGSASSPRSRTTRSRTASTAGPWDQSCPRPEKMELSRTDVVAPV